MDVFTKEFRSEIMSRIKSKDTKPELLLRKALYKDGLRYRIHYDLPGKPDIVFCSKKIVIFINGCFWHGHRCRMDHIPKDNSNFWKIKIENNIKRDLKNYNQLKSLGWEVLVVWECFIISNLAEEISKIKSIVFKNEK
jgi:DNA mismatch endonuclease, patch repair protein